MQGAIKNLITGFGRADADMGKLCNRFPRKEKDSRSSRRQRAAKENRLSAGRTGLDVPKEHGAPPIGYSHSTAPVRMSYTAPRTETSRICGCSENSRLSRSTPYSTLRRVAVSGSRSVPIAS